jgi:hypothetical protein
MVKKLMEEREVVTMVDLHGHSRKVPDRLTQLPPITLEVFIRFTGSELNSDACRDIS